MEEPQGQAPQPGLAYFILAILGAVVLATAYTAFARPWSYWLTYGPVALAGGFVIAALPVVASDKTNKTPLTPGERSLVIVTGSTFAVVLLTFSATAFDVGKWLLTANRVTATVVLLVTGLVLFRVRQFARSVYGIAEILVGLWVGVVDHAQDDVDSVKGALTLLCASLYLIVRGCDNVVQGVTASGKRDPFALAFLKILHRHSVIGPDLVRRSHVPWQ